MNSAFTPPPAQFSRHDLDSIPISPLLVSFMSVSRILYCCSQSTEGNGEELPERIELFQVPQYRSSLYFLWRKTISHLCTLSISMPLEQNSWYSTPFLQNKINHLLWLNSIHSIFPSSLSSIPFIHYLLLPCCLLAAHPVCLFLRYASYWNSTQPNSDESSLVRKNHFFLFYNRFLALLHPALISIGLMLTLVIYMLQTRMGLYYLSWFSPSSTEKVLYNADWDKTWDTHVFEVSKGTQVAKRNQLKVWGHSG